MQYTNYPNSISRSGNVFLREVSKMKYVITFMLLCLSVQLCTDAYTDTLYLKSGKEHKGTVINQNETGVVFCIGDKEDGIEIVFSNDEVLRIEKAGAEQLIKVPIEGGSEVTIPKPQLSQIPLFTNLSQNFFLEKNRPFYLNRNLNLTK